MRHLVTLIWSLILLQMVNFVLNSLNGGGTLNFITPVIIAVIFTLFVILISSMNEAPRELEHSKIIPLYLNCRQGSGLCRFIHYYLKLANHLTKSIIKSRGSDLIFTFSALILTLYLSVGR